MMHEERERPPNIKSHAYHFSIFTTDVNFAYRPLLPILDLPECIFKGWRL